MVSKEWTDMAGEGKVSADTAVDGRIDSGHQNRGFSTKCLTARLMAERNLLWPNPDGSIWDVLQGML